MKIKKFNESVANVNYFDKMVINCEDRYEYEKMIIGYLAVSKNYYPAGIYIRDFSVIYDSNNTTSIEVYTDSNNNQYRAHQISDIEDFNLYCNNPELYLDTKKYNL